MLGLMLRFKYIALASSVFFILQIQCSGKNAVRHIVISNTRRELKIIANAIKSINSNLDILQGNSSQTGTDVAFKAILMKSISTTTKTGAVVVFDKVEINEGIAYDVKSGKFTAPEDGIYIFHWTCMTHQNKMFRTFLVVNGNRKVGNHVAARLKNDDHDTGSQTYVGRLKKGNQVWIETYGTETYLRGDGWSAFSGYIL